MRTMIVSAGLALALLAASTAGAAQQFGDAPSAHRFRAGPHSILVYEGAAPPGAPTARNSLTKGVRIYEIPYKQPFAAVAAQEIFEVDYKSARPFGADKREMELISHEVESLVAARHFGFDLAEYERVEAESMTRYPQLRGMSGEEILRRMRAYRPQAERWIAQNGQVVRDLVNFRFPR